MFAFAIGVAGMMLLRDHAGWFLAFGIVALLIVLFEAYHFVCADVQFLRLLRDTKPATDDKNDEALPKTEGTVNDGAAETPQENAGSKDEQLPLL